MEDDSRNLLYQDYTGSCLGLLVNMLAKMGGGDADLPGFMDLVYPKEKWKETKEQTGREIVDGLISRLLN